MTTVTVASLAVMTASIVIVAVSAVMVVHWR